MIRYILTRITYCLISLFLMTTLTFVMMKAIPGDPFSEEKALSEKVLKNLYQHYGLDKPLHEQYITYFKSAAGGDLGTSLVYPNRTVNSIIKEAFPVSAILGAEALAIALVGGIFVGMFSACYYKTKRGAAMTLGGLLVISIPSFVLAALLQYFFAIRWPLLPIARWGGVEHTILPALALSAFPFAYISRLIRAKMVSIIQSDYVKNAYAKGMPKSRVLFRHALPNALIPVISYLGQFTASILTGSFIIEKIYGIPGLGQWYIASIMNRDYPVILGTTLFYSVLLMTIMLLFDLLYAVVDPRIRTRRSDA